MIRTISRAPDKVIRISSSNGTEISNEQSCLTQNDPTPAGEVVNPAPVSEMKVDSHEFFARLEDYFIAKYGDRLATVKAQMLLDACGPGRDIDPQTLFIDDSDGDSWAEAIDLCK